MPLTIGARIGPYEVTGALGAGGMGEVYRASDSILKRTVALKVLPASVAGDAERLARFQREAEVLAALNHPNIAAIFGLESSGNVRALVMEFVDGPTLADLLDSGYPEASSGSSTLRDSASAEGRGSLQPGAPGVGPRHREGSRAPRSIRIEDTLAIAAQIALALEAAHERGIVHRDLKPANIILKGAWGPTPTRLPDGSHSPTLAAADITGCTVKVLDFGLAKAVEGTEADGSRGGSGATMTSPAMTAMGMILGTAAYMSPEQAKGRTVDQRADIWAFGVVVYEMLTGRRAFPGDDVTETLAAVIRDTPDFSALPAATPRRLRDLVERCLVRDPKLRLRDIGDARIELAAIAAAPAAAADVVAPQSAPNWRGRLPWLATGLVAGVVIGGVVWMVAGGRTAIGTAPSAVGRFQMTLPVDVQLAAGSGGSLSVSPDGRTLVFVAQKGTDRPQLWLRTLDSTNVKPLPGTEGGALPFWSPDGAHIGFFAGDKLKRMDLRTSAVTTICDAGNPGGGTWNAQDTIVFSPMLEGPLFRVSAGGGTPSPLTTLDVAEVESNHMWPHFLPDGRHYLFQVLGLNNRGIYAGTLDGPVRTPVIRQDGFDMTAVQYSSSGHLVYVRNHQLVARPFDVERMTVSGDEVALADGFGIGGPGRPQFSISRTGVLAFRPSGDTAVHQPTWFSRSGVQQGTLGAAGPYSSMELSKDGRTLAFDQFTEKESSTWLLDLARGTAARFTADAYSVGPVWFPDGDRLAYVSVRDTPPNPFMKTLAGVETRLARLPKAVVLGSVTPDGATILGDVLSPGTNDDLWLFPTTPTATPTLFLQTPFNESMPRLSPDGRWVAFTSDESGTNEIYVTTFPKAGRRHRVSADVGTNARWSADGKEIIYRSRLRMMSATFAPSAAGEPSIGTPRVLFTLPEGTASSWVVADNGQRFLFNLRVTARQSAPMTVVLNWPELVRGQ